MNWWIWRIVRAGFGTLTEVREQYCLSDILDAHEVLDLQAEAQRIIEEEASTT